MNAIIKQLQASRNQAFAAVLETRGLLKINEDEYNDAQRKLDAALKARNETPAPAVRRSYPRRFAQKLA